ncbi:hypothetical protein FACS1894105_11620 [Clostridia bacterium]|nr:hypothetical protein FACS1894105_11620 [Clostridia bacterium]
MDETLHKYSRAFIYIYIKNNPNIFGVQKDNIPDEMYYDAERMILSKNAGYSDNDGDYWTAKIY